MRKRFKKADLSESKEVLVNPDRGFLQIIPFVLGEVIDFETIVCCLVPEETLVQVLISLERFRDDEIPAEALLQLQEILDFFAAAGKDMVLRVVYDMEGNGMVKEPTLFSTVSTHMEQIAEILAGRAQHIFVYQGVLLGNWGEMHGSKYLDETHMASLMALLTDTCKGLFFRSVRTPEQLMTLTRSKEASVAGAEKLGLFDDAILGSATDCGTFLPDQKQQMLAYLRELGASCPIGGEVVLGDGYGAQQSAEDIVQYFANLHVTYLNRQHDREVLQKWQEMTYQGQNLYEYLQNHLGYRYQVKDVKWKGLMRKQPIICLENLGFAPLYEEAECFLVVEKSTGERTEILLEIDLRKLDGREALEVPVEDRKITDASEHTRLSLLVKRKVDGAVIQFANRQQSDGSVLLGEW